MSTARLKLRYRPAADALSGHVRFASHASTSVIAESPDADTKLLWSSEHLLSFQIVHAAARLVDGELPFPREIAARVALLITSAQRSPTEVDDPLTRLLTIVEANSEIALEDLRRTEWPSRPPSEPVPRSPALVANSLRVLADAIEHRAVGEEPEAIHTNHFSRLLRELSSTIGHGCGEVAPGTSAAARAASRQGVALNDSELAVVQSALHELDHPRLWPHASRSIEQLVTSLAK